MNAAIPVNTVVAQVTLADIAAALGVDKSNAARRSKKESWSFESKPVRGGKQRLYAINSLPKDVQKAIQAKALADVMPVISREIAAPIIARVPESLMTDRQRLERDARMGVIAAIDRAMINGKCSKEHAMVTMLTQARMGTLDEPTANMLRHAKDPRGRSTDEFPSIRTLKRWLSADDLTPKHRACDMTMPPWADDFLAIWQTPQKPSVDQAYQIFHRKWPDVSVHKCRRLLSKLGAVVRERGRMGPRELKNIQPFIRRDQSKLLPNDIWTADGHTFDAEVQHPVTGKPFRPEITAIIDVATRKLVGWSIGLAESGLVVLEAIRHGVEINGVPAVFYVDNGSGYKNQLMSAPGTGLMGRLGTEITFALPYNSQAKGVIERAHQSIWIRAAKMLESYVGADMDKEAKLRHFKITRKSAKQGGAMPMMPWHLFLEFCEAAVADYNSRSHRTNGGVSPDLKWKNFEAQGFNALTLDGSDIDGLFRPQIARKVIRGEIRLFNNLYFSRDLAEFHGDNVFVAYDIHDAKQVWVHNDSGQLICVAECDGNKRDYMPVPFIEQSREKTLVAKLKRNDADRSRIIEEGRGRPAIEAPRADMLFGGRVIDAEAISSRGAEIKNKAAQGIEAAVDESVATAKEVVQSKPKSRAARTPEENYAEWTDIDHRLAIGEPVSENEAYWHEIYQTHSQFKAMQKKAAA